MTEGPFYYCLMVAGIIAWLIVAYFWTEWLKKKEQKEKEGR